MRKLISVLLAVAMIFALSSCSQRKTQPKEQDNEKQSEKEKNKEDKPDKKEGEKVLHGYARALILRDNKVNIHYSENMKRNTKDLTPSADPHPNGYSLDTIEEKEGSLEGKLKIFSVYSGEPYFSSDESKVTIVKEKDVYVIDKIEKSKSTEVNENDKVLFIKKEGDVKGKEVIKIDDIPRFATPQGASPDQKFVIGREKFGPIALDPEEKKLAVTTMGENPALMIVDIEKKQVKPLDLFFEGNARSIAWSQDGKFIALEMSNREGSKYIYIYDTEKEKRIDDPMKDVIKPDKYSVNNIHWISETELVFNVSGVSKLTPDEEKKAGSYKFDVKNVNLTKY